MLRWRLTLGLLGTLIILLLVGTYGVWLFNDLGKAIEKVLRRNYDSIKVCHYLRVATARVNTFYSRSLDRPSPPYDNPAALEDAAQQIDQKIPTLLANATSGSEQALVEQLRSAATEYIQVYRTVFAMSRRHVPNIREQLRRIPELTLRITNLSENILQINEAQMLIANRDAKRKTRESIRLLIVAMMSSIGVYVFTYSRLGQMLVTPIRKLTQSIRELRSRAFDQSLEVTGNDEVGQLTSEFNAMAAELRNFYRETDRKFIQLNQEVRSIITALPFPLFLLDDSRHITRQNPAAERLLKMLGLTDALPAPVERFLDKTAEAKNQLVDLKQAILLRADEHENYYMPRVFRLVLEDGKVSGRALMLVDVTRFRWLDEMKSDLLATLSHEIKTPLTGIRLTLHLLAEQRAGTLSADQVELVVTAREDCERLLKTLNSILELARMEGGQAELNVRLVPAGHIADNAYRIFHEQFNRGGLILITDVAPDLPEVRVDVERIGLALSNFLTNAFKYSTAATTVTLQVRAQGNRFVRYSVMNQGPGIALEEQGKVFDKFYRARDQDKEGAGLGLSIAREIVQAHEGKIGVRSSPGGVTEFFCDLPASAGHGNYVIR